MTLEEIDREIAAQQRRLLTPALLTKQDVDHLRNDVDRCMRGLLAERRALVKREGGG